MRHLGTPLLGLFLIGLAASLSLTFAAPVGAAESTKLQRIIESGELRVGLSADQAPLNMRNKDGEIVGLDVDIVNALASAMGLEARLVNMPFANLLPALEKDQVDIVVSGMTITPERNVRVAFAGPYFISGKSVLTKNSDISTAENVDVLNTPDRTYAALKGSTSEKFVKEFLPNAQLITTPNYDAAVQLVLDDKVDALIGDYQVCMLSVWRHREAGLLTRMSAFTVEPLGVAIPADAPLLVNLVDNYLETLEYTGLLGQFKAKWLSDGAWVSDLP